LVFVQGRFTIRKNYILMKIFSSLVLVGILSLLCSNFVEPWYGNTNNNGGSYPDDVQPFPLKYTQVGRTEIAQKACAIPGPRGYRGLRGPTGDQGATGPAGLPGLLGSQVELVEIQYTNSVFNLSISPQTIINPSTPGNTPPYGVVVSRSGFPVNVLISAVVNVHLTCVIDVASGLCQFASISNLEAPIYLTASLEFTQVTENLNGGPPAVKITGLQQTTIYIPVNYPALQIGGATGNVLQQLAQLIDASDTSTYYISLTLSALNSASAPFAGYNYFVSGNMVASIYYGSQIFPSPSPIV